MTWQELVFSSGNAVFAVTLIPTLRDARAQVPRTTSLPIAAMLFLYVAAFGSLRMPFAAFCVGCTAVCWSFIAYRRAIPPRKPTP